MNEKKKKSRKRIIKEQIFIRKTVVMNTIVNIPLHPKTGTLMIKKMEVEERKKVCRGWHMHWNVLLARDGGRGFYLREVIA